jgi:cell wall-associated NlpC family hydrolase
VTSDENATNQDPARSTDPVATGNFDSFTCSICNTTFPAPGFDANQVSQALRQHVAANHQDHLQQTALDAAERDPAKIVDESTRAAALGSEQILKGTVHAEDDPETLMHTSSPQTPPEELTSENETFGPAHDESALPDKSASSTGGETAGPSPATVPNTDATPAGGAPVPAASRARDAVGTKPAYEPLPRNQNEPAVENGPGTLRGAEPTDKALTKQPTTERTADAGRAPAARGKDVAGGAWNTDDTSAGTAKERPDTGRNPTQKPSTTKLTKQAARDPQGSAAEGVQRAVQKGLEAAGSSVGVPPQVTRIVIKVAKRVIPIGLAMVLIMFAALGGGALFGGQNAEDYVWNVPLSEQLDIPEPYLDAYLSAARRYKLPWTVLAAVGANATYHGRIDPYKQEVPLPSVLPDDEDTENFVLLADAGLNGVETYLNPFLVPAGYSVEVVTLSGGAIQSAVTWLDENNIDNRTPIVVALGANDGGTPQEFAAKVDQLLNLRGLHNRIYWLTLTAEGAEPYNQVLRERDRLRPNLTLIDWAGLVEQRAILVGDDGVVDDAGQRARAGLIAAAIIGNIVSAGLPISSGLSGPGVLPTPTGDCPSLTVAVEGANPSQGSGPLMLTPLTLTAAGYDLGDDIQNVCTSVDTLAEVLAQTARLVAGEEGTTFPSGIANLALQAAGGDAVVSARIHKFWAKVLDTSGVLGDTIERACELPEQGSLEDQAHVGNMIDAYWRCTLAGVELSSVETVTVDAAGNVDHRLLNQPEAVARGVEEALSVAWTWSTWGTLECDATAVHAGVFPLTATVFAVYADDPEKGRCDREENIMAAAKVFAGRESVAIAYRGRKWSAAIGGWTLVGPVSGPIGPTNFDNIGPWQPLYAGAECTPVLVGAVLASGNDPTFLDGYTAGQAQEVAFSGTFDEFDTTGARTGSTLTAEQLIAVNATIDTKLAEIVTLARTNPFCAQERAYADQEWLGVIAGAVNGDALTSVSDDGAGPLIPATTRGDLNVPANIGDRIAAMGGRAASRSGGWGGVSPAASAYLQRLSPIRVEFTVRPLVERELGDGALSIGYRLVNLAAGYYGGIFIGNDGATSVGIGFVDETIPFNEEFNSVGQEYGIDPRLLAAVARQESNFKPESGCNPSGGAFGMMQKEYDTVPTLCGDVRRQIEEAAKMLLSLYDKAGDWKGALWGYDNGALFAQTWAELGGDEAAARQYAIVYYREARNPTTGQTYCPASGECARAEIAMKYISETPGDLSAMLAWLEYQGLFPALVLNTRQTVVNGTECPNVAPASAISGKEPLRGGADTVGIRELCVEAVAQAATPEAARAIIFAFNNLGITYSQELRSTPRAFDCSSYVSRSYESAGLLMNSGGAHFNTRQLLPWDGGSRPDWVVPVAVHLAKPGDLVFPAQGHVAMKLTRGFIIHTNSTGDVSHVTMGGSSYSNPLQTNRVVSELAPRLRD